MILIFHVWAFNIQYILILVASFLRCSLPSDFDLAGPNWEVRQEELSSILNKTIALQPHYILNAIDRKPNRMNFLQFPASAVLEPCSDLVVGTRIGCCQPGDGSIRYVFNAKLEKLNNGKGSMKGILFPSKLVTNDIISKGLHHNDLNDVNMVLETQQGNISDRNQCKSFFNGTLHMIGFKTTHNVYHAGKNLNLKLFLRLYMLYDTQTNIVRTFMFIFDIKLMNPLILNYFKLLHSLIN